MNTVPCYTLSVKRKKLITSSEQHSLQSTASKLIIFRHISYSSPYEAHLQDWNVAFAKKEKNVMKSQKITLKKSQKPPQKAAYSEHSIAFHSISKAGYVTAALAIVHTQLRAREASGFCDFWKMTSCKFTLISSYLTQANIIFLKMCLVRSIIANLWPIKSHFNALDFNVCRSEEVLSFFWRSVYYSPNCFLSVVHVRFWFWFDLIWFHVFPFLVVGGSSWAHLQSSAGERRQLQERRQVR